MCIKPKFDKTDLKQAFRLSHVLINEALRGCVTLLLHIYFIKNRKEFRHCFI